MGRPDFDELIFLEKFLRQDDIFYDVGANAGAYAVLAAGLGCSVVAFEPVPLTFERLSENATLNQNLKFSLRNCAVGSSIGTLKMTIGHGPGNHVLRDGEVTDFVEASAVTLNSVVLDTPYPTFIKADVEGFELEMLLGANDVLKSTILQGLLLETFRPHNWNQPKLQAIEALLAENGFFPFHYDAESNTISQLMHPQDGENNTFYFRAPEDVKRRLRFLNLKDGWNQ